ncbi:hypothetical protein OC835_007072 [Tilletia horrida]|nr:hypothetical protein OC835_007072 [Tilletia horrida]
MASGSSGSPGGGLDLLTLFTNSDAVDTLLSVRYFLIALATVVVWEHLLHLPNDFDILYRLATKRRIRLSDTIFLIVRYSLVWYVTVGMLFFFGRSDGCDAFKMGLYVSATIGSTAMNSLFLSRVWLLWNRATWAIALPGLCLVADTVIWIVFAVQWKAYSIKKLLPAPAPACVFGDSQIDWHGFNWAPRIIFEGLASVLTLVRLYMLPDLSARASSSKRRRGFSDMRSWLRNSNFIYFGSTFAIYITGLIGGKLGHDKAGPVIWYGIAQVAPLLIGIRLILATPSRRREERERRGMQKRHSGSGIAVGTGTGTGSGTSAGLPPPASGTSSFFSISSFAHRRTGRRPSSAVAPGGGTPDLKDEDMEGLEDGHAKGMHSMNTFSSGAARVLGSNRPPLSAPSQQTVQMPPPAFSRSGSGLGSDSIHGPGLGGGAEVMKVGGGDDDRAHIRTVPYFSNASRATTGESQQSLPTPDGWWRESYLERSPRADDAATTGFPAPHQDGKADGEAAIGTSVGGEQSTDTAAFIHRPVASSHSPSASASASSS